MTAATCWIRLRSTSRDVYKRQDGTLTNTEKVITPRTKAALQEAARRGVCIVLASGWPTVGIEPLARELELEKYGGCILSYNGGKIIDCRTGQTLVQHAFPADPVSYTHLRLRKRHSDPL